VVFTNAPDSVDPSAGFSGLFALIRDQGATDGNKLTDADRFDIAVSQIIGKRLTYAEVTGKVGETAF
jgi:hypothetical protein